MQTIPSMFHASFMSDIKINYVNLRTPVNMEWIDHEKLKAN